MRSLYDCTVFCDDPAALAPVGVAVRDQLQAFRAIGPHDRILHQIGNNGGHVFVLRALRQFPGVVTIHDIGLFYLYELETRGIDPMLAQMAFSAPRLASVYGRHWKRLNMKTAANYALFDMQRELLQRSSGVVVHSHFARAKLQAIYGPELTRHVSVIPHFAPPAYMPEQAEARRKLGLPADAFIVTTSGFATRAKRFDWMMEALEAVLKQGLELIWIHAGEERPEEYDVSAQLQNFPLLRERTRITGYIDEEALNAQIAACDLLLNLRFPSVGESSGTLARALAAGRCCVVSDTASYRELPREAVIHLPVFNQVRALVQAVRALHQDRSMLHSFGANARRYAETELSMASVAARYREAIEESQAHTRPRPGLLPRPLPSVPPILVMEGGETLSRESVAETLRDVTGHCRLLLKFRDLAELAASYAARPPLLAELLPEHVKVMDLRVLAPEDAPDNAAEGVPAAAAQEALLGPLAQASGILLQLEIAGSAA
ncbi:glycosyltransferase family 4 protein [Teichococcus aestuarii]|uniref:Glycosyl transferase family 1 domain-containing protein n=1 Tax=Teichococcus aestuarii TaxID=568898 RepID=A0A2U1UXH5_9PROT|nr:glycosyltransferase family 4 protein [Pseudoroseomonas aestuarii]PWC26330.1 hypothetical protein CR165_23785 [Pseudoroseomonas aestuarii]